MTRSSFCALLSEETWLSVWPRGRRGPVSRLASSLPPWFAHLQAEDGVTSPRAAHRVQSNPGEVVPHTGALPAASDAADAKSSCGFKGRTDNSRDRKAPGATEYLEITLGLGSPRAGNTLGEHRRDVHTALLFPALLQTLPFT